MKKTLVAPLKALAVTGVVALSACWSLGAQAVEAGESYQSESESSILNNLPTFQDILDFSDFTSRSLEGYVDALERLQQRSIRNIHLWAKQAPEEARSCRALYDDLFRDGVMRVTLAFGYQDSGSQTLDGRLYQKTVSSLTRSCPSSSHAVCGYRVVAGSRSGYWVVLEREVALRSDNGARRGLIRIQMAQSSLSSRERDNLQGGMPTREQQARTRQLEDLFFGGISGVKANGAPQEKCEICAYYGHARDGGGPDFGPVPDKWRTSEGKPNYDIYRSVRPGYRQLISSLERSKDNPPKLVSLQGCNSYHHFWTRKTCAKNVPGCAAKNLKDYSNQTGFLLSRQLSWPQNYQQTVGVMLDTVLGLKCRSAWKANSSQLLKLPGKNENYDIFGRFF